MDKIYSSKIFNRYDSYDKIISNHENYYINIYCAEEIAELMNIAYARAIKDMTEFAMEMILKKQD